MKVSTNCTYHNNGKCERVKEMPSGRVIIDADCKDVCRKWRKKERKTNNCWCGYGTNDIYEYKEHAEEHMRKNFNQKVIHAKR